MEQDSSGNDSTTSVTSIAPPRRRSSIFKLYDTTRSNSQESSKPQLRNDDLQEYKLALELEMKEWKDKHVEVIKEHADLKTKLTEKATMVSFNLKKLGLDNEEFFEHSIYHEYIHSVEKFCDTVTCILAINKNNDIKEKNILDLNMKKIMSVAEILT